MTSHEKPGRMPRRRFTAGLAGLVPALSVAGAAGAVASPLASSTASPRPVLSRVRQLIPLDADSQDEQDLRDGTVLAGWETKDGAKEFRLTLAPRSWQTEPGGRVFDALSINGHVPGPTIRVKEGDRLRLIVKNEMDEDTSIHWHGMDLPNDQDGVPGLTQPPIQPGETHVYEWTAISTGTHWYHSHMHGDQEGRGLYGSLEVVPSAGDIPHDRDFRVILGDGALGYVFNGRSFPGTTTLRANVGERVRIRVIGAGPNENHPIHLHGGYFEVVAQDGNLLPAPLRMDTVLVGVGQTYDLIWRPTRPGKWLLHCHVFSHSKTRAAMTGMVTVINVDPPKVPIPTADDVSD